MLDVFHIELHPQHIFIIENITKMVFFYPCPNHIIFIYPYPCHSHSKPVVVNLIPTTH